MRTCEPNEVLFLTCKSSRLTIDNIQRYIDTTCTVLQTQQRRSLHSIALSAHLLAELGSRLSLDPVEVDLAGGGQIGLIRQRREDLVDDAAGR